jgi:hypothetical protein
VGSISAPEISLLAILSHHSAYKTDLDWKWIYLALIPLIYTAYRYSQPICISWLAFLDWFVCTLSSQFLAVLKQPDNSMTSGSLSSKVNGLACFLTFFCSKCAGDSVLCITECYGWWQVADLCFCHLMNEWLVRYLCSSNTPKCLHIFNVLLQYIK